jgi:hypothetical protein
MRVLELEVLRSRVASLRSGWTPWSDPCGVSNLSEAKNADTKI